MGDFQPPVAPVTPVTPEPAPVAPLAPDPAPSRSPMIYMITAGVWLVISLTLAISKWLSHRFSGADPPPLGFIDWVPVIVASLAVAGALALLAALTHAFLKYIKPIAVTAAIMCLAWIAFKYVGAF